MIFADLHVHTYYSDGIHSPEEVLEFAKDQGVQKISITDHDTIYHLPEVQKAADAVGIQLIKGVEMSCYNFKKMKKIHIIALGLSDVAPNVEALCNQVLEGRNEFHKKMIKDINALGYDITFEDAKRFSKSNTVFKMHLYQAIREKYPEVDMTFYKKHFLKSDTKSVDLQMNYVDIRTGIEAILKDGGTPILAHPNLYDSFPETIEYIGYGLKGIEISHPSMGEADVKLAKEIAEKYGLIQSGGSDFHFMMDYNGKPELGQFGLNKEQYDLLINQVL